MKLLILMVQKCPGYISHPQVFVLQSRVRGLHGHSRILCLHFALQSFLHVLQAKFHVLCGTWFFACFNVGFKLMPIMKNAFWFIAHDNRCCGVNIDSRIRLDNISECSFSIR